MRSLVRSKVQVDERTWCATIACLNGARLVLGYYSPPAHCVDAAFPCVFVLERAVRALTSTVYVRGEGFTSGLIYILMI